MYIKGFKDIKWVKELTNNFYNSNERIIEMNVVNDLIEGRVFEHWFNFLISNKVKECDLDYEDYFKKSLIYLNLMNTLVDDISTQCPVMYSFDSKQDLTDKEIKYLIDELDDLEWTQLSMDIVRDLETKGDVFFQIYYDDVLKKHRIIKLESKNMLDIIVNDNEPTKYVYKNKRLVKSLNIENGIYTHKYVNDLIIFTEGYYVIYYDVTNLDINTSKENKVVVNTKEMGKIIPLIHIKGKKRRKDTEFSLIPCVDYIDSLFYISTIITDIRSSNRSAGSPRTVVLNGELDLDRSVLDAGGIIHINTPDRIKNFSSSYLPETNVKYFEITNSLASLNKELAFHIDYLYNVVGLIPLSLREKMSTSDSSKAISQFRSKQEVKNKYYLSSIRKGFAEYFAILLKDGFKRGKKRDKVLLQIPEMLVISSIYDSLLLVAQKLNLGITTLQEHLREQGYTDEQIDKLIKEKVELMHKLDISNSNIKNNQNNDVYEEVDTENINKNKDSDLGVDNRLKKGM